MSADARMPDARAQAGPLGAAGNRVDVWELPLGGRADGAALAVLSEAERAFAARLRIGAPGWIAARASLRRVLARYLGVAPARVPLASGPNGKPRLAAGARPDLRFNLAHCGDLALVAVRLGREVGVDLERLRAGVDGAAIARDVFSPAERARCAPRAGEEPAAAFFRAWVEREALAKATGRGIATPPGPGETARFTVRALDGIPGHAAAVASEGAGWRVRRIAPYPARLAQRSFAGFERGLSKRSRDDGRITSRATSA